MMLTYEGYPIRARQVTFGLCRHPVTSCALLPDIKILGSEERCDGKAVGIAGSGRGDQGAGFARRLLQEFACGGDSGQFFEEQVLRGEAKSLVLLNESAKEEKARTPKENKTGATGGRQASRLNEMRATFFGDNAAVMITALVRESQETTRTYSSKSQRRRRQEKHEASGATREVKLASGASTGDGGGRVGVSEVSNSAPSDSDAGAPSTPLVSSREGGSSRGDTADSVAQPVHSRSNSTKGKARAAPLSALAGPAGNPAEGPRHEFTEMFDGSADEDGCRMEKCVESSPALAAMEDECPGNIGDSQDDDPDNAEF